MVSPRRFILSSQLTVAILNVVYFPLLVLAWLSSSNTVADIFNVQFGSTAHLRKQNGLLPFLISSLQGSLAISNQVVAMVEMGTWSLCTVLPPAVHS